MERKGDKLPVCVKYVGGGCPGERSREMEREREREGKRWRERERDLSRLKRGDETVEPCDLVLGTRHLEDT